MQEGKKGPLGPTVLLMLRTTDTLYSVIKSKRESSDRTSALKKACVIHRAVGVVASHHLCRQPLCVTPVLRSPLLHLQRLFLLPAVVHGRLRVDAPGRRSALAHRLLASLRVCAAPLCLPPLCSAVLKPNLRSKTIDLTKRDTFAPLICLLGESNSTSSLHYSCPKKFSARTAEDTEPSSSVLIE